MHAESPTPRRRFGNWYFPGWHNLRLILTSKCSQNFILKVYVVFFATFVIKMLQINCFSLPDFLASTLVQLFTAWQQRIEDLGLRTVE